jgi:thiamine kinase-like enzyme
MITSTETELISGLNRLAFFSADPVRKIRFVGGGGNSRVYLIQTSQKKDFICKKYFSKDRLDREYAGFEFLAGQGMDPVPRAFIRETKMNLGIYQYIEGRKIRTKDISNQNIMQLVDFWKKLKVLSKKNSARIFPPAKDACLKISDITGSINSRLEVLEKVRSPELKNFLSADFKPGYAELIKWSKGNFVYPNQDIPGKFRSLSPSDFGFHNAVKTGTGNIVFLDFEYFGFDDPAKIISDFILHPKTRISHDLKQYFVSKMLPVYADDRQLSGRIRTLFPFFGMKWCLIMLNEFLDHDIKRREFAGNGKLNRLKVRERQLAKAEKMFWYVMKNYRNFPYDL